MCPSTFPPQNWRKLCGRPEVNHSSGERSKVHRWESRPEMCVCPRPRSGHTTVVQEELGIAVMFGGLGDDSFSEGQPGSDPVLNDVWLLNLETDAWKEVRTYGDTPNAVFGHTAVLISTDPQQVCMLVFGGQSFGGTLASDTMVLFDVLSDAPVWKKLRTRTDGIPRASLSRWGHTMVAVREDPGTVSLVTREPVPPGGNMQLLVFGGMAESYESLDDVIVFDLAKHSWSRLQEGVCGGQDRGGPAPPAAGLPPSAFDTDVQPPPPPPPSPPPPPHNAHHSRPAGRRRHIAALDSTGTKMWVFGGRSEWNRFHSDLWYFDLVTFRWEQVEAPGAPLPRTGHCGAVHGRCLYIFGGFELRGPVEGEWDYVLHNDLHCFNTHTMKWERVQPEPSTGGCAAGSRQVEAPCQPHTCPDLMGPCLLPRQRSMAVCFVYKSRFFVYGGRDKFQAFHCMFSTPLPPARHATLVQLLCQYLVDHDVPYTRLGISDSLKSYLDSLFAPPGSSSSPPSLSPPPPLLPPTAVTGEGGEDGRAGTGSHVS